MKFVIDQELLERVLEVLEPAQFYCDEEGESWNVPEVIELVGELRALKKKPGEQEESKE